MHFSFDSEYRYVRGSIPKSKINKRFYVCRHVVDSQVWAIGLILSTRESSSLDSARRHKGGGRARPKKKNWHPYF